MMWVKSPPAESVPDVRIVGIDCFKFFPAIRAFEDFLARRPEMLFSPERHAACKFRHNTVYDENIYGSLLIFSFHAVPPETLGIAR